MNITDRLSGDTNVLCIACGTFRRIGHMVADLDGPAFVAYFCDAIPGETCVPASQEDAETLYREQGYRRTADGWRRS